MTTTVVTRATKAIGIAVQLGPDELAMLRAAGLFEPAGTEPCARVTHRVRGGPWGCAGCCRARRSTTRPCATRRHSSTLSDGGKGAPLARWL